MNIILIFIGFIVIGVGVVINIIYLINILKLLNYVRKRHFEAWQALGGWAIYLNGIRLWRYLQKEEYKNAGDEELNKMGEKTKKNLKLALSYTTFAVFIIFLIIVFKNLIFIFQNR